LVVALGEALQFLVFHHYLDWDFLVCHLAEIWTLWD